MADDTNKKLLSMRGIRTLISDITARMQFGNKIGMQYENMRDLYKVYGYPQGLTFDLFMNKYSRQDIVGRIIDAPAGATWKQGFTFMLDGEPAPEIDKQWGLLDKAYNIRKILQQADRLARLAPYSILLINFKGTGGLATPAKLNGQKELLYMRAIPYNAVVRIDINADPTSPAFGRPKAYEFDLSDKTMAKHKNSNSASTNLNLRNIKVDASRIIHIVENALENDLYGVPIIAKIYNILEDLLKVTGGTAETYWKIANRGLHVNVDKDMSLAEPDQLALEEMIEEYEHDLRRIIQTRGVDVKSLGSEAPKPADIFDMLMALLAGATGIPQRILLGAEAGQLASEQDRANWAERIEERREMFAEPVVLNPLIKMFQAAQLLPEGNVTVTWPSAFVMSPLESSMVMAQTARAIGNISRQTGNKVPMQLTSRVEARKIIGLRGDLEEKDVVSLIDPNASPSGSGRSGMRSENSETEDESLE